MSPCGCGELCDIMDAQAEEGFYEFIAYGTTFGEFRVRRLGVLQRDAFDVYLNVAKVQ